MKHKKQIVKIIFSCGILAVPFASAAAISTQIKNGDINKSTTYTINAQDISKNLQLVNVNYDDFAITGNEKNGTINSLYFKTNPLYDSKGNFLWTNNDIQYFLEKARFGLVYNSQSAFPGLTVTLNWQEDDILGRSYKTFDDHLELIIKAEKNDQINFINADPKLSNYGSGTLSNDRRTLKYNMSGMEVIIATYNQYSNDDSILDFKKNDNFRSTMERLQKVIYYENDDYPLYTTKQMQEIYSHMLRGDWEGYNNWIAYDNQVISDKVFEAAANYANAVIENDDNILGFENINNWKTPNSNKKKAIMRLMGGPSVDMSWGVMSRNNGQDLFQNDGEVYFVNEGQFGVEPRDIVLAAGTDTKNKYLQAVKKQKNGNEKLEKLYEQIEQMVVNPKKTLSNKASLILMSGVLDISDQDLWIALGMAYGTIDADRTYLLGKHLRNQQKTIVVNNEKYQIPTYDSVIVAGISHGLDATLDTIFHGRYQEEFVTKIVDKAIAFKNSIFPAIHHANPTGYEALTADDAFQAKANAAPSLDGIDWNRQKARSKDADDIYNKYDLQPMPSIHYFNKNLDTSKMSNYLSIPFNQNEYNDQVLPGLDSDAVYRPYNAKLDWKYVQSWDINDVYYSESKKRLFAESMMVTSRRYAHQVFGFYDEINGALKTTNKKYNFLKDFIKNNLYFEASQRDYNIGLMWKEEYDFYKTNNLHFYLRDDRPNLDYNNNGSTNNSRGKHIDMGTKIEWGQDFGNQYI